MKKITVTVFAAVIALIVAFTISDRNLAKQLAIAQVPGAEKTHIREFDADFDDGRLEYEVEIFYNGREYEFTIDSFSDTIIKRD